MAFATPRRSLLVGLTALTGTCLVAAAFTVPAAQASPSRPAEGRSTVAQARAQLEAVAPRLGVDPDATLRATSTTDTAGVGSVTRFSQTVDGVPVYGAELVVALDPSGDLTSVAGDTVPDTDLSFTVTPAKAMAVALAAGAKRLKRDPLAVTASTPRKLAYDPSLVGDAGSGVRAVWRVVVSGARGSAATADVIVDATDAHVVSVNSSTEAINRAVCDAETTANASAPAETAAWQNDAAYGWCGEDESKVYRDTNNDGYVVDAKRALEAGLPSNSPLIDAAQSFTIGRTKTEDGTGQTGAAMSTDVNTTWNALNYASTFYNEVLGYDLTTQIGLADDKISSSSSTARRLAGVVNYCDPAEVFYDYLDTVPANWHNAGAYYANRECSTTGYANAYWADSPDANGDEWFKSDGTPFPGGQMFIGKGLAASEDVIGHELTHGVTSATNGLIYQNQSGAINESMSDVFGQLVEEYKFPGTDTGWLVGEKLNTPALHGAIRSMSNPTRTDLEGDAQPDKLSSSLWDNDPFDYDSGGVHANSGVGNKTAWLIAHGGTFNGVTINKLDSVNAADSQLATAKIGKLYWRTQQLLPSNATYRTLGATLVTACNQLVGTSGFTSADCVNSVGQAVASTGLTASSTAMSISRTAVKAGESVVVTGRVADARGSAVGAVAVRLQRLVAGTTTWADVPGAAGSTNSASVKSWTVKPDRTTYYRVAYLGSGALRGATSAARGVTLTPTVSKTLSAKKIKYKKSFKVSGTVAPRLVGKTVWLQRYSSGKWRTVKKAKLSSTSKYKVTYKPTSRADRNFRVYLPAATSYRAGISSKFLVTVK